MSDQGRMLAVAMMLCISLLAAGSAGASGPVVGWGVGGQGRTTPPLALNGVEGTATSVDGGELHSCAIQNISARVFCWGSDDYGEATPPPDVDGTDGTATAISLGLFHSCAIQAGTGRVVC